MDSETLKKIKCAIEKRERIEEIIRGFDSPHVETTVGLIDINSASVHKAQVSDDASWFHREMKHIEMEFKEMLRGKLYREISSIDDFLSQFLK